jgi:hypothetical protein
VEHEILYDRELAMLESVLTQRAQQALTLMGEDVVNTEDAIPQRPHTRPSPVELEQERQSGTLILGDQQTGEREYW